MLAAWISDRALKQALFRTSCQIICVAVELRECVSINTKEKPTAIINLLQAGKSDSFSVFQS